MQLTLTLYDHYIYSKSEGKVNFSSGSSPQLV